MKSQFTSVETSPHVALFFCSLGGGGAEKVMLNLASGFIERGIKVDLVLGKASGPHLKKVPPGVRLVDLKASGVVVTVFALARYLQTEKPCVVISAMHYANEIALWARCVARVPTRIVVTEHNTLSRSLTLTTKIRRHLIPLFIKYFYPWADRIVTVSQKAAEDLAQFTSLPLENIHVIYNPVVNSELLAKARESIEHHWFLSHEPPVILGVGKLEAQKDFPTLIRAFAWVRKVREARLAILGWGPDRPQLEALIQELGLEKDVALLGYSDNPYAYMARASVFVLSSAWEGLPTVLIEAMAVGTPVVSTNCPSGPAEILDNGKYGWLTPVGDGTALAKAILTAIDNKQKQVDSFWLEQFSLETATQKYLDLCEIPNESSQSNQVLF